MNKTIKIISIILAVIVLVYLTFVTIDVIRLRNSKLGTKPVITVSEKVEDNKVIYSGLGYNVKYYVDKTTDIVNDMEYIGIYGYGVECRFLGILIWAWVE